MPALAHLRQGAARECSVAGDRQPSDKLDGRCWGILQVSCQSERLLQLRPSVHNGTCSLPGLHASANVPRGGLGALTYGPCRTDEQKGGDIASSPPSGIATAQFCLHSDHPVRRNSLPDAPNFLSDVRNNLRGIRNNLRGIRHDLPAIRHDLRGVRHNLRGIRHGLRGHGKMLPAPGPPLTEGYPPLAARSAELRHYGRAGSPIDYWYMDR